MALNLRIIRFWTDYVKRGADLVPVDKVEYCQPGMASRSTTVAEIARLQKIRDDVDPDNPAFMIARERWATIQPAYEAWKSGQEIPLHGTPLAIAGIVTPQEAEIIKTYGLKTVEEFAEAPDSVVTRIQLPAIRDKQALAKRFCETAGNRAITADLDAKDEQIRSMSEELKEMRELLEMAMAEKDEPKRRGRPPKNAEPAPAQDESVAA